MKPNECYFDAGKRCRALTCKECEGCKFRKTEEEFERDAANARRILYNKGLRPILKWEKNHQIVSVATI